MEDKVENLKERVTVLEIVHAHNLELIDRDRKADRENTKRLELSLKELCEVSKKQSTVVSGIISSLIIAGLLLLTTSPELHTIILGLSKLL